MSNVLEAESRTGTNKSALKQLRDNGKIPAVVYGFEVDNTPIFVDARDFTKTIREVGRNGVISLNVEGNKQNVVLQDYQEDIIRREIIHIDFLAVDMTAEIEAEVRIELVGEPIGVKSDGVLQQPLFELTVLAKPDDIPESIKIDISTLDIGDTFTVADLKTNDAYKIVDEPEETIATVLAPEAEEEETEEEEMTEPEVIGEKDEEEEES